MEIIPDKWEELRKLDVKLKLRDNNLSFHHGIVLESNIYHGCILKEHLSKAFKTTKQKQEFFKTIFKDKKEHPLLIESCITNILEEAITFFKKYNE